MVAYFKTKEEAEASAEKYRKIRKVKTDVFRVKYEEKLGWYVEQDIA